jgi:hypothetical protein
MIRDIHMFHLNDDQRSWVKRLLIMNNLIEDPGNKNILRNRYKNNHTELTAGGSSDADIATPTNDPEK